MNSNPSASRPGAGSSIAALLLLATTTALAAPTHVWEKVEISLQASNRYSNPYTDAQVWVDLKGPGFARRCYGFWDGGDRFRVRVLANAPGRWTWSSGSQPSDAGLAGHRGAFEAMPWTAAEMETNSCRRGNLRATANGHAFEHADGTPCFLVGDTWWATPTFRFPWRDDNTPRPLGPDAGFKDFVRLRRQQEFNCIALIAALPNWANDGHPATLKLADGTVLRSAWREAGTERAKDMTNEFGQRAFFFPGKVPGFESVFPDVDRLNASYFQTLDRKIDYLNAQGFIPFIEVARRDVGQAWKRFYPWPQSYVRFVQYVWSRYQAHIALFSPIHFDTPAQSLPPDDWNLAAKQVLEQFGPPPFGTLVGNNANPSSLRNWGHVDRAPWLGFHQIGNRRTHDCYAYLTEIFRTNPPLPAINGEPYYDGMEDAEPGTERAALYCRSAMYGSVLSGGLGGHIYGAGGWQGGLWSGEVEAASKYPIWKVVAWPSADQMRHLKRFVLSAGRRYQELEPATDMISPNRSGKPDGLTGWAYAARTPERDLFLLYFEQDCRPATLTGARPNGRYRAQWFDPRAGPWRDAAPDTIQADAAGKLILPPFPGSPGLSDTDWALKLASAEHPRAAAAALTFVEVTQSAGLIPPLAGLMGHGAAWGDVDGDGRIDLFVGGFCDRPDSEYAPAQGPVPNRLLRNLGQGRFELVTDSPITTFGRTSGAVFADFDNNGTLELYVANNARAKGSERGGDPQSAAKSQHNQFFRNDGGRFVDLSVASEACPESLFTARNIGVFDYDGDGRLDLFLVEDPFTRSPRSVLLRNGGGLKFTDVTREVGLPEDLCGTGLAVADLNGDGRPDFLAGYSNRLFLSQPGNRYREAVELRARLAHHPRHGEDWACGVAIGDLNRDGRPDVLISAHAASARNRVFLNDGIVNGCPQLREVTKEVGLADEVPVKCPHVEIQDFDNDGWPDIYFSAGWLEGDTFQPLIFHNAGVADGRLHFSPPREIQSPMVYFPAGPSADYDGDGRMDLFLVNWFKDNRCRLLRNETPEMNWLEVQVVGQRMNRSGIGAKVRVMAPGTNSLLGFQEINTGYGYASGQPAWVHFGLGSAPVVNVQVTFADGQTLARQGVSANQRLVIGEP